MLGQSEELKAVFAHSPETIGGGSGLESAAAQYRCPSSLDGFGRGDHLFLVFNGAGPGHDYWLWSANHGVANFDDSVGRMEFAAGQLVRLGDHDHLGHSVHQLHLVLEIRRDRTKNTNYYPLHTLGDLGLEAPGFDAFTDGVQVIIGGVSRHYNNHFRTHFLVRGQLCLAFRYSDYFIFRSVLLKLG